MTMGYRDPSRYATLVLTVFYWVRVAAADTQPSPSYVRSDRPRGGPSVPWRPPRPRWSHAAQGHGAARCGRSPPASGSTAEGGGGKQI